jgi:hypothetical protein
MLYFLQCPPSIVIDVIKMFQAFRSILQYKGATTFKLAWQFLNKQST